MELLPFRLGPMDNNTYVLADPLAKVAVVIDPTFEVDEILKTTNQNDWQIREIWFTHAHFDHLVGYVAIQKQLGQAVPLGLHPADLFLWERNGLAGNFMSDFHQLAAPSLCFSDEQMVEVAGIRAQVLHVPGHSPGHVAFYIERLKGLICGDVIFAGGIGRSDLPGGDELVLEQSIRSRIYTLPDETILWPGHGSSTTVGQEKKSNPFVHE